MTREYQSAEIKELAAALAKAQGELQHAKKGEDNPFFKSKYADLPAIIDASRPMLARNGLSVCQMTDVDEAGKITLVTQLSHSSGQWMRSWYPVNPIKNDPQGIGSAITYARRYAYSAITGVAASDEDDDGNMASGRSMVEDPLVETEQAVEIDLLLNSKIVDRPAFMAYFKIADVRKLKLKDFATAKAMLEKKADKELAA